MTLRVRFTISVEHEYTPEEIRELIYLSEKHSRLTKPPTDEQVIEMLRECVSDDPEYPLVVSTSTGEPMITPTSWGLTLIENSITEADLLEENPDDGDAGTTTA